jgi:deoxyribonuclease IV
MTAKIHIGPTGLGSVEDAVANLEKFASLGFEACEVLFTYGAYIKEQTKAEEIGEAARKLGIQLSIHAPYFVNLNSAEPEKIEASKKRILSCLKVGTWLGAKYVVFHPGFYGKMSREETYENIKIQMLELEKERKKRKYTPKLAPETMGKINVFGSIEEIARLVKDTKCYACIDFAHILARSQGDYRFKETLDLFKDLEELHIHFSGIIYTDKGEKKHKPTEPDEWKQLLKALPKNKNIFIVCESPIPMDDATQGLKVYNSLKK